MENLEQKSEKQVQWEAKMKEIEGITDKLNKPIDERIKETVIVLNLLGINTTGSCEGHSDWGIFAPYIDIESREIEKLEVNSGEHGDKIGEVIERKNLEERRKIIPYLEEFYKGRETPYERRLVIESMARSWSRLQSQGVDFQKIEDPETKSKKLKEYQEEMRDLTEFLKVKFFS